MADSLVRLRIDSQEFDSKLKSASQSLTAYLDKVKKGGGDFRYLDDGVMECAKALGQLSTKTSDARGSISEMTKAFTNLSFQYRQFTDAEKSTPLGKEMKKSLDELKSRIMNSKTALADINKELSGSKFGDFGNVIDTVGRKLGVTGNITEMVTSKTALMTAGIGASVAIIGKATEALVSYNNELAKQDQVTTVTTGLKGDAADNMTNQARALADTYKVDFREAINAANTLMTQFGKSGEDAMKLISDGMQGMIQGNGPKLLSMIQQYAPAFRDAGVSASQLVAVIQNSEGGIFTDQNMNAIVMGIKNIRLMTKATSDALAQLGIDGQKMSQQLRDGSMTIFDALKQVATQIQGVNSNSQAAGEVMQQVFGRQGVTAGTNLGKAIETLNTNLQETKRQTGEVGDAYNDLYEANVKLNKAIRDCFEYDGWKQMATGIKAKLVTALADVLDKLGEIKKWFAETAPDWLKEKPQPVSNTKVDTDYISRGATKQERQERYTRVTTNIRKKLSNLDTQEANLGKPYSYTDKEGGLVEKIDTPEEIAQKRRQITASRQQLNRRLQTIQAQEATLVVEPPKTPTKIEPIYTPTGSHKATPAEQADAKYDQAQKDYNQALEQAAMEVKAGTISSAEGKKKELQATETLWKAIGDAREVYDSPKLKEAQEKVEGKIIELGPQVEAAITAQKAAEQSARELEQAQKKVSSALEESAKAYNAGDLKGYITAQKKVGGDATVGFNADVFSATEGNIQAFIGSLKEQLSTAELGSTLYNNLKAQLADATMFANLIEYAVKNGIDLANLHPEEFWKKIFTDNPGDYIDDAIWEELAKAMGDGVGKNLSVNTNTGEVKEKKNTDDLENVQKLVAGMQSVSSGLQQMGIKIPDGVQKLMSGVQGLMTVIQGVQSIISVFSTTTAAAQIAATSGNTVAMTALTAAVIANTAALEVNAATNIIPFARGGIVPHAAQGYFIPGTHRSGDTTPIMANAGELVLNESSQSNLAAAIKNAESLVSMISDYSNGLMLTQYQQSALTKEIRNTEGGIDASQPFITGEMIYLGLQAYLRRSGMGEIVTSE